MIYQIPLLEPSSTSQPVHSLTDRARPDDRKQSVTSTNSNPNSPTTQQFPQQQGTTTTTAKLEQEQAGPSSPTADLAPQLSGGMDRRDSAEWGAYTLGILISLTALTVFSTSREFLLV
jgi:hypothetical protein